MSAVDEPITEPAKPAFKEWPKTLRLGKTHCVVTEKIDGTNAAIHVVDGKVVAVQSRNRFIVPGQDNAGFAGWVEANAETLASDLGDGIHFGEWWGVGIGPRKYSQCERFFSLFNTRRFFTGSSPDGTVYLSDSGVFKTPRLRVVPVLAFGSVLERPWEAAMSQLKETGSVAVPGHMNPEGVIVFFSDSFKCYKVLCENDDKHKGELKE